jgi:hypothetical protein
MSALSHAEWCQRYGKMRAIAERVAAMRNDRARVLCREAGLDSGLLGIHPHNAMVGLHYGKPWPGVDYHKVRKGLWLLERQWDGFRILTRWDERVRSIVGAK